MVPHSSAGAHRRRSCKQPLPIKHLAGGSNPTLHIFLFSLNVLSLYGANSKYQFNAVRIDIDFNRAFQLEMKPQYSLILLHLT